jgi:hypothetical protein
LVAQDGIDWPGQQGNERKDGRGDQLADKKQAGAKKKHGLILNAG